MVKVKVDGKNYLAKEVVKLDGDSTIVDATTATSDLRESYINRLKHLNVGTTKTFTVSLGTSVRSDNFDEDDTIIINEVDALYNVSQGRATGLFKNMAFDAHLGKN
jgi:hypothetical protein